MKHKKVKWAEVHCDKHGVVEGWDKQNIGRVTVNLPTSRKDRVAGCHQCKRERNK